MAKYMASHFYCTQCGKEGIPVQRKKGQERESGHLKRLYCIYCKEEVNHVEIKDNDTYTYDDFLEEFNLGRFKDGNRDTLNDLIVCSNEKCKFNRDGRCWNSNYSFDCPHRPKQEGVDNYE